MKTSFCKAQQPVAPNKPSRSTFQRDCQMQPNQEDLRVMTEAQVKTLGTVSAPTSQHLNCLASVFQLLVAVVTQAAPSADYLFSHHNISLTSRPYQRTFWGLLVFGK
ncbi:hypothetical protein BaRGS_00022435, partial [Batillaria attramentaria]